MRPKGCNENICVQSKRFMSTPISDLPDEPDDYASSMTEIPSAPIRRGKKGKLSYIKRHKDALYVFVAVVIAMFIPIDSFRYRVPEQVFALGDAPIRALLASIFFIIIKSIMN